MSGKLKTLSSVLKRFNICNITKENRALTACTSEGDVLLNVYNFFEGDFSEETVSFKIDDLSKKISAIKPDKIIAKGDKLDFSYKKNQLKSSIFQNEIKRDLSSSISNSEPEDPAIFFIDKRHIDMILSISASDNKIYQFEGKLEMFSDTEGEVVIARTDGMCCFSKFKIKTVFKKWKPFRIWCSIDPFKMVQNWESIEFRTDGFKHRFSQDGVYIFFMSLGVEKISLLEKCNFESLKSNIKNSENITINKKELVESMSDFKKISEFKNVQMTIDSNRITIKSRMIDDGSIGLDEVELTSKSGVSATLNLNLSMLELAINCVKMDTSKDMQLRIAPFRDGCYLLFVDSKDDNSETELLMASTL